MEYLCNGCGCEQDNCNEFCSCRCYYSTLARPLLVYVSTEALKKQEVTDFMTFFIENSMEIAEDAMFIQLNKEGLLNLNEYSKLIYDNEVGVMK